MIQLARIDSQQRISRFNQTFAVKIAGDLDGGAPRPFSGTRLEHVEDSVLDRKLKVLHIPVVRLEANCDFLIIDNPGRDDPFARVAVEHADTLVTPMNDSFVDFDLIGQVDAETFKVRKLSFFAELIWEARLKRSRMTLEQQRPEMDWIVVRNRTGHVEAKNQARLHKALNEMSKRVGFRVTQGLSERVIYRELFPSGLTLLDKGHLGELGTSHLVARQELRSLVKALHLPEFTREGELELA